MCDIVPFATYHVIHVESTNLEEIKDKKSVHIEIPITQIHRQDEPEITDPCRGQEIGIMCNWKVKSDNAVFHQRRGEHICLMLKHFELLQGEKLSILY